MSSISPSLTNITVQYLGFPDRVMISVLTTLPSCVFLVINGIMLFTLRSKPVFRETCRYVLLYNLLFADTVQLGQSQVHLLLLVLQIRVSYPLCAFIIIFTNLTTVVSPLTLVVMPLERYVAVCYPLRHAAIITIRNTGAAVTVIWTISFLNIIIRTLLFLELFEKLDSLKVKGLCSDIAILLTSKSDHFDKAFTSFVFVSAGVAVMFSYIGVILAARSASTDKALAHKARNTLVLNLIQLCLSLSSTIYYPLLISLSMIVPRIVLVRIQNVFYVIFIILPRCLTSLIYGLRDQTIRPVLTNHLCCRLKLSGKRQRITC
ncbi:odorant receptor 131-2-like [Archocentrus centrarchus]|uniref:odorant receptor 131-2-like n=1 Tax=Archocentrus centrarchus TaxID=63155 RepID=UPI0011EA0701|nr:odorant receptor 131-2-like [Archocentrus centrarchus]